MGTTEESEGKSCTSAFHDEAKCGVVCLITRMGNVGEGAEAVGKRRRNVIRLERSWVFEMVFERHGGRRILRRGKIKLD